MRDINALLEQSVASPPNILATLQRVQEQLGYVPRETVPQIASALGVTDSDVVGVLSFYHDLRTEPPGRHTIRFCLGDSCRAWHTEKNLSALERKLGCKLGETSRDKRFSLEKIYCLGNCALSPNMMVGEDIYCRLTPKTTVGSLANHK